MPPAYVKAYVKRNKNDAADAEAICEAVTRPTMRFVPIKSPDAQSVLMLHRARQLLVRQRTAQVSALRAHLAEYGIIAPKGRPHVQQLVDLLDKGADGLPELARQTLLLIADMISGLSQQIRKIELMKWHRADGVCQRLETIPGIGFITATALAATVNDARAFRSGRQFSAWLGLVPKQHSSGGKERLGAISKMGDRYLRHLLVVGATAVLRYTKRQATTVSLGRIDCGSASQPDWYRCARQRDLARGEIAQGAGLGRRERTRDADPVKPGIGTTWVIQRALQRGKVMRTQSTDIIMASGLSRRANRPNT